MPAPGSVALRLRNPVFEEQSRRQRGAGGEAVRKSDTRSAVTKAETGVEGRGASGRALGPVWTLEAWSRGGT